MNEEVTDIIGKSIGQFQWFIAALAIAFILYWILKTLFNHKKRRGR